MHRVTSTNMQRLLAELSAHHFPNPPATPAQVAGSFSDFLEKALTSADTYFWLKG